MTPRNPPMLTRSPMSGRIYIATKYKKMRDGAVVAYEKHDTTDAFGLLMAEVVDALGIPIEVKDQVLHAMGLKRSEKKQAEVAHVEPGPQAPG
jgi:hypothetical protein